MREGLTRTHWWTCYTWRRSGIGMAHQFQWTVTKTLGLSGAEIEEVRVEELRTPRRSYPLRVCLRVARSTLLIDRAFHPVSMQLYGGPAFKRVGRVGGIPFLVFDRRGRAPHSLFDDESARPFLPGVNVHVRTLDEFKGARVDWCGARGTSTLAVGSLPHELLIVTSERLLLRLRIARLERRLVRRLFRPESRHDLGNICAVEIQRGQLSPGLDYRQGWAGEQSDDSLSP